MDMSLQKRFRSSTLAMLVGLGVLGCCVLANLVLAHASSANVPAAGLNCKESDGKISGRGSTYQNNLQEELAKLYRDDFCGNTGVETPEDKVGGSERGEAGNTMLAHNYPVAEKASATGSGSGLKATSCRTDAFGGTDLPYNNQQLKELNEAPETLVKTEKTTCAATIKGKFTPPFQPNLPEEWPDKEAGKEDTTAPLMSFPAGGSAVALAVNLTEATCSGKKPPTSLEFTKKEVSRLFGGEALTWNDAELVANNPGLKECTASITRVVRFDNSGTTNIFKSYLIRAEGERTAAVCAPGKKWSQYTNSPNTEWPGKQNKAAEGGASCGEIITAGTSGGPALVKKLKETEGGIGYADLSDAAGQGLLLANVVNATGTTAVPPNVGKEANCTYSVVSLPGATKSEAVGLNSEESWSNNNELNAGSPPNHENPTFLGSKYPICGLTFDLVYTGLSNTSGGANPISRLSADQRRTMYSYFSFLLSSAAQNKYGKINYAPLPESWLQTLREGFQENF